MRSYYKRAMIRFAINFAISFAICQTAVANQTQCSSLFNSPQSQPGKIAETESYPPKYLQQFYKTVGSWSTKVPFHVMNVDLLMAHLAKQPAVTAHLIPFEKGRDSNLNQLVLKEFSTSFIVIDSEKDVDRKTTRFTLKDTMGRWFEIPGSPSFLAKIYKLDFSKLKFIPSENNELNRYKDFLNKTYTDQRLEKMSAVQLGEYLSNLQLHTSSNAEKRNESGHQDFVRGIKEANLMLAEILVGNKPFSREHLENLNLKANQGINPYEWKTNAPMAGVLRGTNDHIVTIKGKPMRVDMTQFEVAQTWNFSGNLSVLRLNYFLPAAEVPAKIETLLARINGVGEHSTPLEVFTLYKEFIHTHPFADGNGRTGRMLLNFLLLKAHFPPSEIPAASLFYRAEDSLRKYIERFEMERGRPIKLDSDDEKFEFEKLVSLKNIKNIDTLTEAIEKEYGLSNVSLDNLHGTLALLFVGVYKGRYIQFESTHHGDLSDSLHVMLSKSKELIDQQEALAKINGKAAPTYAIYPELLKQAENYHMTYHGNYLIKHFERTHKRPPGETELDEIQKTALSQAKSLIANAEQATSEREYFTRIMQTRRIPDQVKSAEEVADRILTITSPVYRQKIYEAMTAKASPETKQSLVDIYNAFNSSKYDEFMVEMAERALALCRKDLECGPTQRNNIPEKYLAQVLKYEADQRGVLLETISPYVGREPGRLFVQRIRRGSLLIDAGAPGNHGLMPHALQSLFIYQEIGLERGKKFFAELTGWTYERMFDSNVAFTPIPSTRDITRRHYWSGVFAVGSRSESSRLGSLMAEKGRYPSFLRENNLTLVEVQEIEKHLVSAGSIIRARYKTKEFSFEVDIDGVPNADASQIVAKIKQEVDRKH